MSPIRIVAFVGIGAIGLPMASALLARNFVVRGYDIRPEARAALVAAGGLWSDTATGAAAGADALVLMVVNAAQAEEVLFAAGALDALPAHGTVILMSTCPPAAVAAIAARVGAAGRRFVDAPVSGGVAGARAARLTIMAAGPAADVEAVRPVLAAMGERIFHVGETPGQGAVVKTVNQLLCGAHLAIAAEALALAARLGVDGRMVLEITGGSGAASFILNDRGPRMLEAEPEVTSSIDIFVKDLDIVMQAGREARAALPMAAIAHQLFLSVSGRGAGAADDSQVIRAYHALNGTAS